VKIVTTPAAVALHGGFEEKESSGRPQ